MDWKLNEENQSKYDKVIKLNQQLQALFGIKSKTIEERAADANKRHQEKEAFEKLMGKTRPKPKWKI